MKILALRNGLLVACAIAGVMDAKELGDKFMDLFGKLAEIPPEKK